MLAMAIVNHLGGGQHQRKLVLLRTIGRQSRLDESRQRILACIAENFGEDFDLPGLRLNALMAITKIVGFAGHADPARLRTQIVKSEFERREDRIETGIDIAIPE